MFFQGEVEGYYFYANEQTKQFLENKLASLVSKKEILELIALVYEKFLWIKDEKKAFLSNQQQDSIKMDAHYLIMIMTHQLLNNMNEQFKQLVIQYEETFKDANIDIEHTIKQIGVDIMAGKHPAHIATVIYFLALKYIKENPVYDPKNPASKKAAVIYDAAMTLLFDVYNFHMEKQDTVENDEEEKLGDLKAEKAVFNARKRQLTDLESKLAVLDSEISVLEKSTQTEKQEELKGLIGQRTKIESQRVSLRAEIETAKAKNTHSSTRMLEEQALAPYLKNEYFLRHAVLMALKPIEVSRVTGYKILSGALDLKVRLEIEERVAKEKELIAKQRYFQSRLTNSSATSSSAVSAGSVPRPK